MRMKLVALLVVASIAVGGCSGDGVVVAAIVSQLSVEDCVEDGVLELLGLMAKVNAILNAIAQGEPATEFGVTGSGQNWSFDCDFGSGSASISDS